MKYVVVSGSSGGIGLSTVKELNKNGYYVFGLDYNEIDYYNNLFKYIKCDLTKEEDIINAHKEVSKITNVIDGIFDIAGIFMIQSIVEGSNEDLKKIIDINFFGTYTLNRIFFDMLKANSKIIVFTSEVARYSPQPFNGYYALPKILLDKYADVLRRELNYLNIKVIKVQSGAIKTNLLTSVGSKYEKMVNSSKYYKKPLTKLKKLMDDEINKQASPEIVSKKLYTIFSKKNPRICYKIKNSFKLSFLNLLPEKVQDIIYKNVIK